MRLWNNVNWKLGFAFRLLLLSNCSSALQWVNWFPEQGYVELRGATVQLTFVTLSWRQFEIQVRGSTSTFLHTWLEIKCHRQLKWRGGGEVTDKCLFWCLRFPRSIYEIFIFTLTHISQSQWTILTFCPRYIKQLHGIFHEIFFSREKLKKGQEARELKDM